MKEWWAILTWQQAVASVLYGVAVFLMLVSLPLTFMIRIPDDPISTWDLLIQLGSAFYHMPEMWMSGSWTDFVQNALPALCLLLAYVLIVPGAISDDPVLHEPVVILGGPTSLVRDLDRRARVDSEPEPL